MIFCLSIIRFKEIQFGICVYTTPYFNLYSQCSSKSSFGIVFKFSEFFEHFYTISPFVMVSSEIWGDLFFHSVDTCCRKLMLSGIFTSFKDKTGLSSQFPRAVLNRDIRRKPDIPMSASIVCTCHNAIITKYIFC